MTQAGISPTAAQTEDDEALIRLISEAAAGNLEPAWLEVARGEMITTPSASVSGAPCRWRWADLRAKVLRAGELVPLSSGGDRRAFYLSNPRFAGSGRTTHTIAAAVQCLMGHDTSSCHRHTATALRFIVEGSGAFTAVDGEPLPMNPGDLLLTPNMLWHDSRNTGAEPVVWMDFLDAPLVEQLNSFFFDLYQDRLHPLTKPEGWLLQRHGVAGLRPLGDFSDGYNQLMRYPWEATERALRAAAGAASDPYDGTVLAYVDPVTGGPVSATLDASVVSLAAGAHTRAHRHTSSACYHVHRGSGASIVNGQHLEWQRGDLFVVPGWHWHEHVNASASEEAILFSVSDAPALTALRLHRTESLAGGGRQA